MSEYLFGLSSRTMRTTMYPTDHLGGYIELVPSEL